MRGRARSACRTRAEGTALRRAAETLTTAAPATSATPTAVREVTATERARSAGLPLWCEWPSALRVVRAWRRAIGLRTFGLVPSVGLKPLFL
jgi:hypothetical protein